jgi:hypothetical protein
MAGNHSIENSLIDACYPETILVFKFPVPAAMDAINILSVSACSSMGFMCFGTYGPGTGSTETGSPGT